jgi:hypothetical protein
MKTRGALSAVLACLVSTIVAAWLLGSFVNYVVDEMGPAGREALMLSHAPWFSAAQRMEIRRIEPITIVGHRDVEPSLTTADARFEP